MIAKVINKYLAGWKNELIRDLQKDITVSANRIRKRIIISIYESILFFLGGVLIISGIIVFLTKFFPTYAIILGSGLMMIYFAFMLKMKIR